MYFNFNFHTPIRLLIDISLNKFVDPEIIIFFEKYRLHGVMAGVL